MKSKKWKFTDSLNTGILTLAGILLFCADLPVRTLWGSEGRWAVVVKEMLRSGNYFLPTINGEVYFDKPLLSYWAIIPFALTSGMTEFAVRLPSAITGIATVLLIYLIGKRLFGSKTGMIAGVLLTTSVMYVFWARTASAELLNVFMVWFMFFVFITGAGDGRLGHLILFYGMGAVASFCKGPVAPAVALFTVGFYSLAEGTITIIKERPPSGSPLRILRSRLRWILSWNALIGIAVGAAVFGSFLSLPVLATGSWVSAQLMWKENVLRFFEPFDHVEPPWIYLKYIVVYCLPWTLLTIISLWQAGKKLADPATRWIFFVTIGIFIFFTVSGSRRSYYILPLIPALALVTAKMLADWLMKKPDIPERCIRYAMIVTATCMGLLGGGLGYVCLAHILPAHTSQPFLAAAVIILSIIVITLFIKRHLSAGLSFLVLIVFSVQLWGFTTGMALSEQMRPLKPFYSKARERLNDIGDENIALYHAGSSSLVFYLDRGPLVSPGNPEEIAAFWKAHPGGYVITDMDHLAELQKHYHANNIVVLLSQEHTKQKKHDDRLVILGIRKTGEIDHRR